MVAARIQRARSFPQGAVAPAAEIIASSQGGLRMFTGSPYYDFIPDDQPAKQATDQKPTAPEPLSEARAGAG